MHPALVRQNIIRLKRLPTDWLLAKPGSNAGQSRVSLVKNSGQHIVAFAEKRTAGTGTDQVHAMSGHQRLFDDPVERGDVMVLAGDKPDSVKRLCRNTSQAAQLTAFAVEFDVIEFGLSRLT